jgi:hypothetical protein
VGSVDREVIKKGHRLSRKSVQCERSKEHRTSEDLDSKEDGGRGAHGKEEKEQSH